LTMVRKEAFLPLVTSFSSFLPSFLSVSSFRFVLPFCPSVPSFSSFLRSFTSCP
jgi:hypothetical protein